MVSLVIHIVSLSATLFVEDVTLLALLHAAIGVRATSLSLFSYGRFMDYINPNKLKQYGSYMAAFEGLVSILIAGYFYFFISWRGLVLLQIILGFFLLILNLLFLTDSPMWLI